MTDPTPATRQLDLLGIPYRIFVHAQAPDSLEEAARQRNQLPEQVIRSILFKQHSDDFFMVLMAGPGQISWQKLRSELRVSRIAMASEEQVLEVTGYKVGAVSPFGLARSLRILADNSVFRPVEISLGSGMRGVAIIMKSADLKKALGKIETGFFA
jgi:Cys-tRNA(Pro)/Cys-tRNA(Cys) deacylase